MTCQDKAHSWRVGRDFIHHGQTLFHHHHQNHPPTPTSIGISTTSTSTTSSRSCLQGSTKLKLRRIKLPKPNPCLGSRPSGSAKLPKPLPSPQEWQLQAMSNAEQSLAPNPKEPQKPKHLKTAKLAEALTLHPTPLYPKQP